ncbi:aldehyde dehydrogenase family protein, partial [Streptomyces rimosus]
MVRELTHFIGGKHTPGTSGAFGDVYDPNTGTVQARVPLADRAETTAAIADAAAAQPEWGEWNPQRRARVLLNFLRLVENAVRVYQLTRVAVEDEPGVYGPSTRT